MSTFGVDYGSLDNNNFVFPSSDIAYSGLVDSTQSFTGGNFGAGDVLLGSPVPLGSENDNWVNFSVPDVGLSPNVVTASTFESGTQGSTMESVSGLSTMGNISDWLAGTHANVNPALEGAKTPTDSSTWAAFGALSKFGSSIATLFGAHPSTVNPNATPSSAVSRGNALSQGVQVGGVTGTNTILLVIVVGAIILLLARSKGE
jgi:hypothetical protein